MIFEKLGFFLNHKKFLKILNFQSQGNATIRKIQKDFFGSRYVGTENEILLGPPVIKEVAQTYGIPIFEIKNADEILEKLNNFLTHKGPVMCEIYVDSDQELIPRMGFTIKNDEQKGAEGILTIFLFMLLAHTCHCQI